MILAIVQARMTSSRLPGKVMRAVLGKPLIGYLLERLKFSEMLDKIIVATSRNPQEKILCDYVQAQGFEIFRGPEKDVLERYYQAAVLHHPKVVVRITADCPLIDYKIVDQAIDCYLQNNFDYVSNVMPRSYPDGLDVEVFSFDVLEKARNQTSEATDREHVTPFVRNSGQFKLGNVKAQKDYSLERWTLDYEEDFVLIKNIIEHFISQKKYFDMNDILLYQKERPQVFEINRQYVSL